MRVFSSVFAAAVLMVVDATPTPSPPVVFDTIIAKTQQSGTSIQRVDMAGKRMPDSCKPPHVVSDDFSAFATVIEKDGRARVALDYGGDEKRYYASLAKMMTLLLALEDIEAKKISPEDRLPITLDARYPRGRHFFETSHYQDTTISLNDALMLMGNQSANDAARVISEALAGNEDSWGEIRFAERMTARAWDLGMRHTVFYDASGFVSEPTYRSTARDMAVLKRALHEKYPDASRQYLFAPTFTVMDGKTPLPFVNGWPDRLKQSLPNDWRVVASKGGTYSETETNDDLGYNIAMTLQDQRQPERIAHMAVMGATSSMASVRCASDLLRLALL